MNDGIEARVLVFLGQAGATTDDPPIPYEASTPGVGDAVVSETETLSEWVGLLSALSELEDQGLIRTESSNVAGLDGTRNVHTLTQAGRQRTGRLRDELREESIEVHDGDAHDQTTVAAFLAERRGWTLVDVLRESDDGVLSLETPSEDDRIVNRTDEIARADRALDAAGDGETDNLLFVGERGVGKTELLSEIETRASERGFETATARCDRDAERAFAPFRRLLELELDVFDDSPFPNSDGPAAEEPTVFDAERSMLLGRVAETISTVESPLLLGVDDMQWADPATIELFAELVEQLTDERVLLVGTLRPVDVATDGRLAGLLDSDGVSSFELDGFDRAATRALICRRLDTDDVPDEFVGSVHEHTGGVPLFVGALVGELLESGVVRPEYDLYPSVSGVDSLPTEVENAVDARIGSLPSATRTVLEWGSVVGERVPRDVLVRAVPDGDRPIGVHTDMLVDCGVWDRDDDTFAFTSGVVRERVLDGVDEDRRREMHRAVGECFADDGGTDGELAARAASHFDEGDAPERAIEYYRRAGERAAAVYANEDAVDRYARAFEIAREEGFDDDARLVALATKTSELAITVGQYETAERVLQFATERVTDVEKRRQVYADRATLCIKQSAYRDAVELCETGLDLTDSTEPTEETCRLLTKKAWAHKQQTEYEAALALLDRAEELAEAVGPEARVRVLDGLASIRREQQETELARRRYVEAVEICREIGADEQLVQSLNGLGIVEWERGNWADAAERFESALDLCEEIGIEWAVSPLRQNLGAISIDTGEWDRALELYDEELARSEAMGDRMGVATCHTNVAVVYMHRGSFTAAETHLESAREIREQINDRRRLVNDHSVAGRVALRRRDVASARESLRRAERALEAADDVPKERARVARLAGEIERVDGNPDAAVDDFSEGISCDESAVETRCRLAHAHLDGDASAAALDAVTEAVQVMGDSGSVVTEIEVYYTLGRTRRLLGDRAVARTALETAREIATAAGATWYECLVRYQQALVDLDGDATRRGRETLETLRDRCRSEGFDAIAADCAERVADGN